MEGVFSFFLESSFLGLFLYGEKRLTPKQHWLTAFLVFVGSWLSGFFIIATDAWMQHPAGYKIGAGRGDPASELLGTVAQPVDLWQYLHNMIAAVVTASFVMASIGAYYHACPENSARTLAIFLQDWSDRRHHRDVGHDLSNRRRAGAHDR